MSWYTHHRWWHGTLLRWHHNVSWWQRCDVAYYRTSLQPLQDVMLQFWHDVMTDQEDDITRCPIMTSTSPRILRITLWRRSWTWRRWDVTYYTLHLLHGSTTLDYNNYMTSEDRLVILSWRTRWMTSHMGPQINNYFYDNWQRWHHMGMMSDQLFVRQLARGLTRLF